MPPPGQMFTHTLNPTKGWPNQSSLDHTAKISANVLYSLLPGQVAHLNAAGQLEPGVVNTQMPLFMFQGKDDLDVNATPGTSAGGTIIEWQPISPTGRVMCLVATGGFELETTEFDQLQTYLPNQPLRAPTGNGAGSAGISGTLTNQGVNTTPDVADVAGTGVLPPTIHATAICGLVSRGVFANNYRQNVLAFWPVWYAGRTAEV